MFKAGKVNENKSVLSTKMKYIKVILIWIMCFLSIFLAGCSPKGYSAVKKELKKALAVKIECIDKNVSEEKAIYTFRDKSGIEFIYRSSVDPVYIDGSKFGESVRNYCDYGLRYISNNEEKIIERCDNSGLEVKVAYDKKDGLLKSINVNIGKYDDVKAVAKLIFDLFTDNRIPIKIKSAGYEVPQIGVKCNGKFFMTYYFLCDYDEKPRCDDIYDDLMETYVAKAKNGEIINDLPQDVLKQVRPQNINTVYINDRIADEKMFRGLSSMNFYYDEELEKYRQAFVIGYSYSFCNVNFEMFLPELGITYSYKDDRPKWERDGISYTAVLSKDADYLIIYQNGQELSRVKVYYYNEYPKEIYLALDTDQLEELFHLNISIDIENAVIRIETIK